MPPSNTFTLYRFFNAEDVLLYVGLTVNPGRRMEKHRDDKPWWPDVARVTMEHYGDLTVLRAAEREAIAAEKPLHNVRMNGGSEKGANHSPPAVPAATPIDGLVGRWFHSWRPLRDEDKYATVRNGRVLEWQGEILERVEHELYLVQTYSWWDGSSYSQQLISVQDMAEWTFYVNHIEMAASLGCQESVRRDGGECGAPAEYITVNFGLGTTPVCTAHAGFYGQVQPIIWRNGVPELGKKTRVPHPLSAEYRA